MAKYRSKEVVEAHQMSDEDYPPWLSVLFAQRRIRLVGDEYELHTSDGIRTVELHDWIVVDRNGVPHPISPGTFETIYEPAE